MKLQLVTYKFTEVLQMYMCISSMQPEFMKRLFVTELSTYICIHIHVYSNVLRIILVPISIAVDYFISFFLLVTSACFTTNSSSSCVVRKFFHSFSNFSLKFVSVVVVNLSIFLHRSFTLTQCLLLLI